MKKAKTFIIVALASLLFAAISAVHVVSVAAEPSTTVYLDVSTAMPEVGQEFNVSIMVSDVQNLWAWQAGIEWDPNILEYVSYTWGDLSILAGQPSIVGCFPPVVPAEKIYPPSAETLFRSYPPVSATTAKLLTITLKAKSLGTSPISLINVMLKGEDPTTTTVYPGWGDANNDWKVDIKDLVIILKNWFTNNYPGADFNGDGLLDVSDLVISSSNFGKSWDGVGNPPENPTLFDIPITIQDISVTAGPDITPPTTAISLQGTPGNPPWYISDVTVTLTATDLASAIAGTDYSLDGSSWQAYTGPFDITTDGITTVYYYSVDNIGNVEPIKAEDVYIDKSKASITITSPQAQNYARIGVLTLDFGATDMVSGVSSVQGVLSVDPATIYIHPQDNTAGLGQVFSFDVCIADAADVFAWQVRLKWDPLILNFAKVTEGDFLRAGGATLWVGPSIDEVQGWVAFGCTLFGTGEPVSGSGILATVTFVGTNIGSGTFEIMTEEPIRTKLISQDLIELPFASTGGYFSIVQLPETHDIAITGVLPSATHVIAGEQVQITVDVMNEGTSAETFDVSVYYDSTLIATITGVFLHAGASTSLLFNWDTTGVQLGIYTIQAQATIVPGETDYLDNTFVNGPVSVSIPVTSGQQIDLSTLALGKYTLSVMAIDGAGNIAQSMVIFNLIENTPAGTNVVVPLSEDVSLSFENVASDGSSQVAVSTIEPEPPTGFKLGEPPIYYDITTTATFSGRVRIKILYDESQFTDETSLRLMQWNQTTQAWQDVTADLDTTQNIIYGDVTSFSVFTVVEPAYGTISGVVTDEYTKQPIEGVIITILETGSSTITNAQGQYYFTNIPTGSYTVEMTVPYGYLTHEAVTKFVEAFPGQDTAVNFTLYQASWSGATVPRTIGYWKNWENHYPRSVMETFVTNVKASSGLFCDLTVDNLKSYLTLTRFSTMKEKGEAQLLASWLNVVSAQLGVDVQVDISSIAGWQTVINDADGILSVNDLLKQIDKNYLSNPTLTKEQWEVIKNILDALNNGKLFIT